MPKFYTSVSELRNRGIEADEYSDSELIHLIQLYTLKIDQITGKTFTPTQKKIGLDGGNLLYRIDSSSIIKVNGIQYLNGGYRTALGPSQYEVQDNTYLSFPRRLRPGLGNVEVDVLLGELDNRKDIQFTLLEPITSNNLVVKVNQTDELELRDVFFYKGNTFIVEEVSDEEGTITLFCPGRIRPIKEGTKLSVYGQIPFLIEEAMYLLIKNHRANRTKKTGMKSERIGNYSYTKDDAVSSQTGVEEVDHILSHFISGSISIDYL